MNTGDASRGNTAGKGEGAGTKGRGGSCHLESRRGVGSSAFGVVSHRVRFQMVLRLFPIPSRDARGRGGEWLGVSAVLGAWASFGRPIGRPSVQGFRAKLERKIRGLPRPKGSLSAAYLTPIAVSVGMLAGVGKQSHCTRFMSNRVRSRHFHGPDQHSQRRGCHEFGRFLR